MAGLSRHTGKPIGNLESAYQGVETVLTTRLGERVMRREFGAGIVEILGRAVTPALFLAWQQLLGTAIDLWEPRFKIRTIEVAGGTEAVRKGHLKVRIAADYRPFAHLAKDDPNYSTESDGVVVFGVAVSGGAVLVGSAL